MLPIAGQTAGLNGLNFFVETRGLLKKIRHFFQLFFQHFLFHGQRWALQLVCIKYKSGVLE